MVSFQTYFQSGASHQSVLKLEWTNQHGCGGNEDSNPQKQNCVLVLQYACQENIWINDAEGRNDLFSRWGFFHLKFGVYINNPH